MQIKNLNLQGTFDDFLSESRLRVERACPENSTRAADPFGRFAQLTRGYRSERVASAILAEETTPTALGRVQGIRGSSRGENLHERDITRRAPESSPRATVSAIRDLDS